MSAEYSYVPVQTVADGDNILFNNGDRACKCGYIIHRSGAGTFKLKGANTYCKAVYHVIFDANIAVATGGTVGAISVAVQEDGETLTNTIATVTPAAVGEFNHVSISAFIPVVCGCCASISISNVSGTPIDVSNANIFFEKIVQEG